jgi:RHS repeat-associated protein
VSLSATATSYNSNQSAPMLTAVATPTLSGSGDKVALYDFTNATLFCFSSNSDSCGGLGPAPENGTRQYKAYVLTGTPPASSLPTTGVLATSSLVTITNVGYVNTGLSLTATSRSYSVNDAVPSFSAVADPALSGGYYLSVYDDTGALQCSASAPSSNCGGNAYAPLNGTRTYTAYVALGTPPASGPPTTDVRAQSVPVTVQNRGWVGTMTFRAVLDTPYFSLEARDDPSLAGLYQISIYDDAKNKLCSQGGFSGGCAVLVSIPATGSRTYTAYLAQDAPGTGPPVNDVRAIRAVTVNSDGTFSTADLLANVGGANPAKCVCSVPKADPVDTDTGAYYDTVTDLAVPGRGVPLGLARTYDTRRAGLAGRLGYGWTDSYDWSLTVDAGTGLTAGRVTIRQNNGSQTIFDNIAFGGGYVALPNVFATLDHNGDGTWTYRIRKNLTYTFSGVGKLTSITDRNGYTTALTYTSGNLSQVTDPAGRTLTFTYDTSNRVKTIQDGLPRTVTYTYDTSGNLDTATDADGRLWTYGYDTAHRLTTTQDPRGNTLTTVFDTSGRATQQTDRRLKVSTLDYGTVAADGSHTTTVTHPNGNKETFNYLDGRLTQQTQGFGTADAATTSYTYDNLTDEIATITDGLSHTTRYEYDSAGNRLSSKDGLDRATNWTYNALNEPLRVTDPLNVTTTNTYDNAGNLLTTSRPLVGASPAQTATATYIYGDPAHPGDLTSSKDALTKTTIYTYDSYGDLASVTDPTARKTTYFYNVIGWLTSTVSPAGNATGGTPSQHTTTYANFTGFGQPKTITDQLGKISTLGYDADQNLTDATDPDTRLTHTDYNANNQPILVTRPGTITQATGYDDNGNMASQTDGLFHATIYGHDTLDRVTSVTDPLSRVTGATYDLAGNTLTTTQPGTPSGTLTTSYAHNPANELTGITYSDGATHSIVYTYDADGQRATMVDGTGTTTYTVDSLHRLTATTNGGGRTVGYIYDIGNRLTTLTYPGPKVLTRAFDDAGRLTSTRDWLATPTTNTFGYDDDGNWTTTTYGNTATATRTFDRADQLTALTYKKGATTLGTLTYTRSNAGLLATTTPSAGAPGTTDTYTRNPRAQLTSSNNTGTTWAYDAADRITKLTGGTTLAYNTTDQLTTSTPTTGPATTHTYDNRGQRTAALVTGAGSSTTETYNQAGRLTAAKPAGGTSSSYRSDGDGLRANKTPAGGTIQYMAWDAVTNTVPMLLNDYVTNFIYGPGGTPVEQIKGTTNTYPMGDQLDSTVLLTGSTGTVTGTWTYNAYGTVTAHTGTGTIPLLFNGQYQDTETGLYYLRARYYDPATGGFLSRDPMDAQTRQPYQYANDDPVDVADPSGMKWCIHVPLLDSACGDGGGSDSGYRGDLGNPIIHAAEEIGQLGGEVAQGYECAIKFVLRDMVRPYIAFQAGILVMYAGGGVGFLIGGAIGGPPGAVAGTVTGTAGGIYGGHKVSHWVDHEIGKIPWFG